jgi:redox-sensitive bicupin YhaK (pirin superfamily)
MSINSLIIEERSRDIGKFLVGRLLPFRKKRMVGPFIFMDHMGPSSVGPDQYLDVDQHPHIGLATLTYLLEGEIQHQDSLGTEQIIKPGDVNWMVAGRGVTHTERTPMHLRDGRKYPLHGFQIWVALPKKTETAAPSFHHFEAGNLPTWQDADARFRLLAGTGFEKSSPVPVDSELFIMEIHTGKEYVLDAGNHLHGEIGMAIISGGINVDGQSIKSGQMLVSKLEDTCRVVLGPHSRVLLFGGRPFAEERYIYWNFVSSSKDAIEKAKNLWKQNGFPKVPGDATYVAMPQH